MITSKTPRSSHQLVEQYRVVRFEGGEELGKKHLEIGRHENS